MTRQSLTNVYYEPSNLADVQSSGFLSNPTASATGDQRAFGDNRLTALPIRSNAGYHESAGLADHADTRGQQEKSALFGSDCDSIETPRESVDIETVPQATKPANPRTGAASNTEEFTVRMHPYLVEGAGLEDAETESRLLTGYTLQSPEVWYKCVTVGANTKEEEASAAGFTDWFDREVDWRLRNWKFKQYTPPGPGHTVSQNLSGYTHSILGTLSELYNDTFYDVYRVMKNKDFKIRIVDRKTLEESKGDLDDKTFYNGREPMNIEDYDDKVRKDWPEVEVMKIEGRPGSTKLTVMPRDFRSFMGAA